MQPVYTGELWAQRMRPRPVRRERLRQEQLIKVLNFTPRILKYVNVMVRRLECARGIGPLIQGQRMRDSVAMERRRKGKPRS
jgi:hypothetical protein